MCGTGRAISVMDWMFAYGKAQGRFVTIAHQDDRYRSDYAEKLLKAWKKYPDLLLFASDYLTSA